MVCILLYVMSLSAIKIELFEKTLKRPRRATVESKKSKNLLLSVDVSGPLPGS